MRAYHLAYPGFPLVHVGGESLIIDTGATHSMSGPAGCRFLGGTGPMDAMMAMLPIDLWGAVQDAAAQHAPGAEIQGLIGVDHLSKQSLLYDAPSALLALGPDRPAKAQIQTLSSELCFDLPVVHATLAGQRLRLVLDTGADCGFLLCTPPDGFEPGPEISDFHPLVGSFRSPTWLGRLSLKTSAEDVVLDRVRFGKLPQLLQISVQKAGVDGVIGADVFRQIPVRFSAKLGQIEVLPEELHSRLGPHYDAMFEDLFGGLLSDETRLMVERCCELAPGGAVLDIGAGTGRICLPLAGAGLSVTAVEPSRSMLGRLLSRAAAEGHTIAAHLGCLPDLSGVPDGYFDLALMAHGVVDYITSDDELVQTLRAAARASKPNGRLILQPTTPGSYRDFAGSGKRYRREWRVAAEGEQRLIHHRVFCDEEPVVDETIQMKPRTQEKVEGLANDAGWRVQSRPALGQFPSLVLVLKEQS